MRPLKNRPCEDSFYPFSAGLPSHALCRGLACFVARHRNPERWAAAEAQHPPVRHLGRCYQGPASADEDVRPLVEAHTREVVLLGRLERGKALAKVLEHPPEDLLRAVERSGLRGRGGAGFPTGIKWRAVARQVASPKFVVANADEGDPGAYMDRFLLEDDPHRVIEAMTMAAYAVGARKGYVYLRAEYPKAHETLRQALAEARREGRLGDRILGKDFSFDIEVVSGRGSYICGEETALLNSIEGKRPEVMPRPPYPTERGLFGKPTLVNNVETLANIPWIAEKGSEAFQALGFSRSRGTKLVSLNSLFRRPGLYEIEFGIPVRVIVEELGGGVASGKLKGVLVGGPLAGVIPPSQLDTPFGFEELQAIGAGVGHGGVIAWDEHTSLRDLIVHVFSFAADESCGKCTPCRLGTRRIERFLREGRLSGEDWRRIVSALASTSLCGLGTGVAEFARSLERHYREELEACFASR